MPEAKSFSVQIKGIRDGLLITLQRGDWAEIQAGLLNHIGEQITFFQGAKVALDVGDMAVSAADLGDLRSKLADQNVTLWAVIGSEEKTKQNAQMLGLATRLSKPEPERVVQTADTKMDGENAILIRRTLRSGYRISFMGHVTVIGDVNPGAEIVAGGDIVVWGKLRGVVHAGADGNDDAVICALDLEPTQLRINDKIAITPKRKGKPQPEIARVFNNQVIAEPWTTK